VLKSKKNKRTAGQIARDITTTLTSLVDLHVKMKRGELNTKLCLDNSFAIRSVVSGTMFGFADFLTPPVFDSGGFRRQTREVWKEASKPVEVKTGSRLLPITPTKLEEFCVIESDRDTMKWTVCTNGRLVMRKHVLDGRVARIEAGVERNKGMLVNHIALSLLVECLRHR
jgi:hypothetical protein